MSHVQTPRKEALRAEQLDMRLAELDVAHVVEVDYLDALLESAKQKFFLSGQREA